MMGISGKRLQRPSSLDLKWEGRGRLKIEKWQNLGFRGLRGYDVVLIYFTRYHFLPELALNGVLAEP